MYSGSLWLTDGGALVVVDVRVGKPSTKSVETKNVNRNSPQLHRGVPRRVDRFMVAEAAGTDAGDMAHALVATSILC